jgi:hypothetical protein
MSAAMTQWKINDPRAVEPLIEALTKLSKSTRHGQCAYDTLAKIKESIGKLGDRVPI